MDIICAISLIICALSSIVFLAQVFGGLIGVFYKPLEGVSAGFWVSLCVALFSGFVFLASSASLYNEPRVPVTDVSLTVSNPVLV